MDTSNGIFIVLEGTDGSGKGTQFKLLTDRLTKAGYDVATFDFPQYDKPSSYFVKQYLNGAYNNGGAPGPYTASLFYALDRYEAAPQIRDALNTGKVVLANRYSGSNMAHQGTKLASPEERRGYFIWNDNLEFEMLHIPRPTISYILRVPADIAQTLVDKKDKRDYTDKGRDLHEDDIAHMQKSVEVYDDLAQLFPKDFTRIDCVRDGKLLPIDTTHELLWQKIHPLLPEAPTITAGAKAKPDAQSVEEPAPADAEPEEQASIDSQAAPAPEPILRKDESGGYALTETGRQFLAAHVSSNAGNIYALTGKMEPELTAALVARFAKRAGDLRSTLLLEFADAANRDASLNADAFKAYGDVSVGQLASAYVVLSGVSSILAKAIEHGRLAAFTEQSMAVSRYETKDATGNYNYYTPDNLPTEVAGTYKQHMDTLFDTYTNILNTLTEHLTETTNAPDPRGDAARIAGAVLPIAAKTTVVVYASAQALENCITGLLSENLPEARETGLQMLAEARKVLPTLLAQTDKSDRGGAQIVYRASAAASVRKLAEELLPDNHAPQTMPVRLAAVWPRNEFDLLPDMLYPYSNRPLQDIAAEVSNWPYDKKAQVFEAYVGDRTHRRLRPGRALEKAHYSWDLVSDYAVFRDLQQHNIVEDMQSQLLTPRYGYDVPKVIEDAGLTEQFETCFDTSLKLYSLLQQAGRPLEAQYATLMGHKLRWKLTYNAREAFHIHELHTNAHANPETRKLVQTMHEKLTEAHPVIGESMKFVR